MKKDELISRRELFRKCAKALLPTIAAFAVSTPAVAALTRIADSGRSKMLKHWLGIVFLGLLSADLLTQLLR